MERTVSELVSQPGNTPHMGRLRCQMERQGRRTLKGYKKRFWVVDERNGRLEVYENDQAHVPIQTFRAADIRNVLYADDKQNRFFVMIVQTREARDIKFRMGSFEERETWSRAITRIMDAYSAINKHKNALNMVQRRAKTVAESLHVNIVIDSARLLAAVPEELLQYVSEAVDIALASVTAIVRAFAGEGVEVPRTYTLDVHAVSEDKAPYARVGPKYNPAARTLMLNVCLLRAKSERVSFVVTQPDEVFRLVQSSVFRSPVIEGWIETDPSSARVVAEIKEYLGLPAGRGSWITFQWGQNMDNSAQVEGFLQRFVNAAFFERALQSVRDAVTRVERLIADTNAPPPGKAFPGASPAAPARGGNTSFASPRAARRPTISPSFTLPPDSASGHNVTSATAVGGGGGGFHSRQPSTGALGSTGAGASGAETALAIRLIRENVSGLWIQLERRAIETGKRPPPMTTVHTPDYEQHCRPAFLLVTKCRRVAPSEHRATGDVLSDKLYEVAYNAFLQQQLSSLRTELNGIFKKQVKVVIMWDLLFRAAEGLKAPLAIEELPHLVRYVKGLCLSRLQHLAQVLRHGRDDQPGHVEDHNYMYNIFCSCVGTIVVDFLPFTPADNARVTEPKLVAGVLTDTLYCAKEDSILSLMAELGHAQRGASGKAIRSSLLGTGFRGVLLYAAEAKLGSWCERYFSHAEHTVPDPRQQPVEDEFDSDSDERSGGSLEAPDFGEAVAYERSAEIRLLSMQRVVNAIYDSQRRAPIDLKIGTDDIVRAIRAFVSAYGEDKRPSKHDVARVLIINLQRLRQMYVRAVDDETTSLLTFAQAHQLLRDFCEYATNEQYIEAALYGVVNAVDPTEDATARRSVADLAPEAHEPLRRGGDAGAGNEDDGDQSMASASTATAADSPLGGKRRWGLRRRRMSHGSSLVNASLRRQSAESGGGGGETRGPFTQLAPSTSGMPSASSGALQIHVPSGAADAFDFACVTEVALTELLPREARLARMAWRVGFVFGLENTGKSLVINSMRGIARPTVATVGLSQEVVAFEEWVWALHELGGRESFRKNWRYYARRIEVVHFLVFVLDILNPQAFGEAQEYLKAVTKHYQDAPLVVVFNNYREGHRRFDIAEFEALIDLEMLRKRHGAEVLSCVCDISVVHSKHRLLPPALNSTLRTLSSLLVARSTGEAGSEQAPPPEPKAPTASAPASVLGGAAGAAAAGAGVTTSDVVTPLYPAFNGGAGGGRAFTRDSATTAASTPRPVQRFA